MCEGERGEGVRVKVKGSRDLVNFGEMERLSVSQGGESRSE